MNSEAEMTTAELLRSNDPKLKKLYLTQVPQEYFDDGELEGFLNALRANTHIFYVLLERRFVWGLSSADYAKVVKAVAEIPGLVELEIWSVRVPIATLCEALRRATNLFRLGLGMVTLTEASGDCSGLSHHPNLQFFYMSDFRFLQDEPDKNLDSLWAALGTCPALLNVEIFSNQFGTNPWTAEGLAHLAACHSLEQLTLRRLKLTGADIIPFANRLRSHAHRSHLKVLNLNQNKFGDGGCVALAKAISVSRSIAEVDLRDNELSAAGSHVVVPLLLGHGSVLEKLNLSSNPIKDGGARRVAEALELQSSDDEFHLKHVDLARCSISDVGCTRLAQAMATNKTLLSLGLAFNDMTNETYVAFGDALKIKNRTLTYLNLQVDRRKIEASGCEALLAMVAENYVLETVSTLLGARAGYDPQGGVVRHARYAYYIRMYLRLNHAGRQKFLEQRASKLEWVNALGAMEDSLTALFYLVSTNPAMCETH